MLLQHLPAGLRCPHRPRLSHLQMPLVPLLGMFFTCSAASFPPLGLSSAVRGLTQEASLSRTDTCLSFTLSQHLCSSPSLILTKQPIPMMHRSFINKIYNKVAADAKWVNTELPVPGEAQGQVPPASGHHTVITPSMHNLFCARFYLKTPHFK